MRGDGAAKREGRGGTGRRSGALAHAGWGGRYYIFCYRSLAVRLRTALHLASWFKRIVDWAAVNEVRARARTHAAVGCH